MKTTTPAHQRERNRAKMAAYRARNPDKTRMQSRDAVRRMRERMERDGIPRSRSIIAKIVKAITPKPINKPKTKPVKSPDNTDQHAERKALIRARFMAFRKGDCA